MSDVELWSDGRVGVDADSMHPCDRCKATLPHTVQECASWTETLILATKSPREWRAGDTIPEEVITTYDSRGLKWKRAVEGPNYMYTNKWNTTQAEPILLELFGPIQRGP